MISERLHREITGLRTILAPLGAQLPPLTVPLLDSLTAEANRVAAMEEAARWTFEDMQYAEGKENE